MNSLYFPRTRKKNKKFHTIFIGRHILNVSLFAAVVFCLIISTYFVIKNASIDISGDIRRYITIRAIPIVSAANFEEMTSFEKKVINMIAGTSFGSARGNFKAIPLFCDVNNLERNVLAAGSDYVSSLFLKENIDYPTGNVSEQSNPSRGLEIKNETTYNINTDSLMKEKCDVVLTHKEPEILIVHTHGSESYTQSEKYHYSQSDYARCQDTRYNVVRVGDELEQELKKRGFNVIHDRTINDYPSYNNSYNKTLGIIESYLNKYPSIKCVFDVHRDAIVGENDTKIKFTADINGEKVSQVMIVCGSDQLGLENPNWQKNLSTALKIQNVLNKKYPGLMRPVNLRKERFNLHKTTASFIFEFGTHGNTLDEALASVKYFADGIEEVLK